MNKNEIFMDFCFLAGFCNFSEVGETLKLWKLWNSIEAETEDVVTVVVVVIVIVDVVVVVVVVAEETTTRSENY